MIRLANKGKSSPMVDVKLSVLKVSPATYLESTHVFPTPEVGRMFSLEERVLEYTFSLQLLISLVPRPHPLTGGERMARHS